MSPAEFPVKYVFQKQGYKDIAFLQTALIFSSISLEEHLSLCREVAEHVSIDTEWEPLLKAVQNHKLMDAIVVTSGIKQVWEEILVKAGYGFKVIGGSTIEDGFVVTADDKAAVIHHIRSTCRSLTAETGLQRCKIWAFGDSELDIPMLRAADERYLVVVDPTKRGRSPALLPCLQTVPSLLQVLLPCDNNTPRTALLPATSVAWVTQRLSRAAAGAPGPGPQEEAVFADLSQRPSSQLIASRMRDAANFGQALQVFHQRAGAYLAHFVVDALGCEPVPIQHVLGHAAEGHRAAGARATTIVALMRGGLPMAMGVAESFPEAAVVLARDVEADLTGRHVRPGGVVIIVDSVINNGTSVRQAVRHVAALTGSSRWGSQGPAEALPVPARADGLEPARVEGPLAGHEGDQLEEAGGYGGRLGGAGGVRVFVVAGIVQEGAVAGLEAEFGALGGLVGPFNRASGLAIVRVLALRTSATKFTGAGGTDTGNRLFNTTFV